MALLASEGKFLYGVMSDLCGESQVENIYTPEMYKVSACKLEDGTSIVKLDMPEPESEPLCYRIYLVLDELLEKANSFIVERGAWRDKYFYAAGMKMEGIQILEYCRMWKRKNGSGV